jgi:hypothetical protein
MLLPGGPPLPPSFGCRSALILRAEQTRRHCQRDAITPRAAVPERVPILATLGLRDANRQAPGSVHLMRPSPFVVSPWWARPAAISGKVAMRILRTTRTRLSLKCCAHDTVPSRACRPAWCEPGGWLRKCTGSAPSVLAALAAEQRSWAAASNQKDLQIAS